MKNNPPDAFSKKSDRFPILLEADTQHCTTGTNLRARNDGLEATALSGINDSNVVHCGP